MSRRKSVTVHLAAADLGLLIEFAEHGEHNQAALKRALREAHRAMVLQRQGLRPEALRPSWWRMQRAKYTLKTGREVNSG